MNRPRLSARFLGCLTLLCLSLAIGMTIPQRLTITKTDSVKYHLFWEIDRKALQIGDYVRLPLFDPRVGCNPCSIVKRIGCLPGDRLVKEEMNFYCNGSFLGQCMTGKNIASFQFNGKVPMGKVFLVGDRGNSYDSRYFGFKSINDIETVLFPLL